MGFVQSYIRKSLLPRQWKSMSLHLSWGLSLIPRLGLVSGCSLPLSPLPPTEAALCFRAGLSSPAANQELHLLKQLQSHSLERHSRFQPIELWILPSPMFSSLPMFFSPRVSHSWILTERQKGFSSLSDGCGFFFFLEHPN